MNPAPSSKPVSAGTRASSQKLSPPSKPGAWFENGFHRFLVRYLGRHFHSVAIDRASQEVYSGGFPSDVSLLVYANHPSWWDPMIAQFLNRKLFDKRHFYAPIDADALEQYKVLEKLGFYGVKLESNSGAAAFLKTSAAIINHPETAIWITPEGRFTDVRDHDPELMPGLSHLCKRHSNVVAVPLALEYVFWDERLPVCLVSLGSPLVAAEHADWSKTEWTRQLRDGLRTTQTRLAELAIARSSDPFDHLLSGTRGGGWFYDTCRKIKALLTGQTFKASHGDQFE